MAAKKKTAKKAKGKIVYDCGRNKGLAKKKPKGAHCSPVMDRGGRAGLQSLAKKKPKKKITRVRKNPGTRANAGEVEKAKRLFADFRGDEPEAVTRITVPPLPKTLWMMGECNGIMYETIRDGKKETYLHRFKKNSRPALCVTPDGKNLYIVGGAFEVTDRGIEDR